MLDASYSTHLNESKLISIVIQKLSKLSSVGTTSKKVL